MLHSSYALRKNSDKKEHSIILVFISCISYKENVAMAKRHPPVESNTNHTLQVYIILCSIPT